MSDNTSPDYVVMFLHIEGFARGIHYFKQTVIIFSFLWAVTALPPPST